MADHTDLLYLSQNRFVQGFEFTGKFIANFFSLPFHHLVNSAFDWNWNFSLYRKYYHNGIERTYGLVPSSDEPASEVSFRNGETFNTKVSDLYFGDLAQYTKKSWENWHNTEIVLLKREDYF